MAKGTPKGQMVTSDETFENLRLCKQQKREKRREKVKINPCSYMVLEAAKYFYV